MRTKFAPQLYIDFSCESSLKVVKEYRAKYERISEILRANPRIVALAHRDWSWLLSNSRGGRKSRYTSEQILRSLIVMFVEQDSYRDVVVRIENSDFLRHFVGLGSLSMMDYSFLSRAFCLLSEEALQGMNRALSEYALEQEQIGGEKLRLDATVYQVNIHHPTDSSLLWDSFRILARVLKQAQSQQPGLGICHRFHLKKVKKLSYFIARNGSSHSKRTQRKVKTTYGTLIARVRWIVEAGREMAEALERVEAWQLVGLIDELRHYILLVEQIIYQAEQRVFHGHILPTDQKLYSLFEPHTELIKRGKAAQPIEFGHKVLIAQTAEKFIHYYRTLPLQQHDIDLLDPTIQAHKRLFGTVPEVLAGDKGFYQSMAQIERLEQDIDMVSICKKGRRTREQYARETSEAFIDGQRFRAGSEGSISVLKRAFKLGLCLFKGFKNFAASVGLAVLCHNLALLTRL
jgi:IS5 family transposase